MWRRERHPPAAPPEGPAPYCEACGAALCWRDNVYLREWGEVAGCSHCLRAAQVADWPGAWDAPGEEGAL